MLNRRELLAYSGAVAGLAVTGFSPPALAQEALKLGVPSPFSFDGLIRIAAEMGGRRFRPAPPLPRDILDEIDYDAHGRLRFRTDLALWAEGPGRFPVTFFHLGRFFQNPVRMYVVKDGEAREILYDPDYFDMPEDSPARRLPKNSGFAGFRFQESRFGALDWRKNDWVAFLGASYFRAIGGLYQYGLSARGVALDVAVPDKPEEFPVFTRFYFETPVDDGDSVSVYALMNSASLAGAFRFVMRRTADVVLDVDAALFMRKAVRRLGLCPLTSMYWFSETAKPTAMDWRPEVHDSDGLALWTGSGERIWRPLNNPGKTVTSAFSDDNPKGFGLLQRDRVFDHYLDGVRYERRPSLWVEPLEPWGRGSVQLVEIPTDDEIHDNIVAMWVPEKPVNGGERRRYSYRLHWTDREPFPTELAECRGLRFGRGGHAGQSRPKGVRKIVIEFAGKPLESLPFGVIPEAVLSASRGSLTNIQVEAVPDDIAGHWRVLFDIDAQGAEPVELRGFLKNGGTVLSETWLYQYHPAAG